MITLRWAIEERTPTQDDERNTFLAPWRIAVSTSSCGASGRSLLTTLYGLVNTPFIPRVSHAVSFCGILVATASYLFAEFALRPVAAQALEAGRAPRRLAPGSWAGPWWCGCWAPACRSSASH